MMCICCRQDLDANAETQETGIKSNTGLMLHSYKIENKSWTGMRNPITSETEQGHTQNHEGEQNEDPIQIEGIWIQGD